jgi:hypothetical protein
VNNQLDIALGMTLIVSAVLILGNSAVSWLMPSDTKKFHLVDVVKRLDDYRNSFKDLELQQALSILGQDKTYYDAKVASSLTLVILSSALATVGVYIATSNLIISAVILVGVLVASLPLSVKLAKATVVGTATTERQTFRSILAMYLMVLGVELRNHPIEIALDGIAEVTHSPIASRITNEISRRIDQTARQASADSSAEDMSLGQAMISLGQDWAIPELELIGEIMHGSVFSPEALSDMIIQQSETMKKSLMREYAKKLESQRPKLAMFALLQVLPLITFLIVPIMASFGKSGL